jgi:hypothetical protein
MIGSKRRVADRHPKVTLAAIAAGVALVVAATTQIAPMLGRDGPANPDDEPRSSSVPAANAEVDLDTLLGPVDEAMCDSSITTLLGSVLSLVNLSDALGLATVLGPPSPSEAVACFVPGLTGGPRRAQTVYVSPTDPLSEVSVDYFSLCSKANPGCALGGLFYGAGLLPASVARLSVLTPDGATTDATLLQGAYVFKHVQTAPYDVSQPVVVTIYDEDDNVIDQRNVNEMPDAPDSCLEQDYGC